MVVSNVSVSQGSLRLQSRQHRVATLLALAAGAASVMGTSSTALAQEDPPPMLQWFECRWNDMERRMPDYFIAGFGAVWLPPVSKGYLNPRDVNQNSFSAGYDPIDRFDLGRPGAQTAYGTEAYFDSLIDEFHRANAKVYVDMVLNHNAGRQTSQQFQEDGGYPGFWMGPIDTPFKDATDNWGDFHAGIAAGYYQSENPNNPRYCLLQGDLVSLIDINQAANNVFIRQPVAAGNPQNIPAGTYFNKPDANNARFYPDQALGTTTVNNPGMWYAGALTTGIFAAPCTVPERNEPASQFTLGKFNLANPLAGDPTPENATGYMLRWVQWMLDVHNVDGFRIDAVKHTPSWFFDTFFDSVVYQRRTGPDGQVFTPYSFGESVEGNDFTFDRYVRMPNGRTTGRLVSGDAFGNRDCLDLSGAGNIRNVVNAGGLGSWTGVTGGHLDSTDDGFNNGTVGVNHIWSHDNGSTGDGGSAPPSPSDKAQGWFAHAYLAMRPGQKKFYHNARGVNRTGGFWPRHGLLPVFGVTPSSNIANPVITNLIQLNNMLGRGEFVPRWTDGDVLVFDRRTNGGVNGFSSNCLVGTNDRYDSGFDERTVATNFPAGTRLVELTGNATSATVDPNNDISDVLTVAAGGNVTIRIPRNRAPGASSDHNRGFVVYAPAIPAGTLAILGSSGTLPAETLVVPSWRRRTNALPIVTASTFTIDLTTTNGDPGAGNNNNADDNAVFRVNAGFLDLNANGSVDIGANGVVGGYEQFVTLRQPLANTANTQGRYQQVIDSSLLPEGYNYISVVAFRKRNSWENPLFRDFRTAIYLNRVPCDADLVHPGNLPDGTTNFAFSAKALDRTVTRVHLIANPASLTNPLSLATTSNQCTQADRFDYTRTLSGLVPGNNTILLLAFEEDGSGIWKTYNVFVGTPCDSIDFNGDGIFPDNQDIVDFITVFAGGVCPTGTCNDIDFNNDAIFPDNTDLVNFIDVLAGGACP
jgi:glycosidase